MYTKQNGKTIFRDYGILLEQYETKVCLKIISYKWDTIFNRNAFLAKKNSLVQMFCEAQFEKRKSMKQLPKKAVPELAVEQVDSVSTKQDQNEQDLAELEAAQPKKGDKKKNWFSSWRSKAKEKIKQKDKAITESEIL